MHIGASASSGFRALLPVEEKAAMRPVRGWQAAPSFQVCVSAPKAAPSRLPRYSSISRLPSRILPSRPKVLDFVIPVLRHSSKARKRTPSCQQSRPTSSPLEPNAHTLVYTSKHPNRRRPQHHNVANFHHYSTSCDRRFPDSTPILYPTTVCVSWYT